MGELALRDFIVTLVAFLCVLAMLEIVFPEGDFRVYTRYAAGMLTVLFLLNCGKKVDVSTSFGDVVFDEKAIVHEAEILAENRVTALMTEYIADDVLSNFPECVNVNKVTISENGGVAYLEVAAKGFVSKEELSKRYGISSSQIIIRGVGEYESNDTNSEKAE